MLQPVEEVIFNSNSTERFKNIFRHIYIRFGSKLYVGIPMGQIVPPLLLICFCSAMKSLTKEKRYDLIDAFNSTSRYLDELLNIDNIHFEHMVHRVYPAEPLHAKLLTQSRLMAMLHS